MRLLWDTRYCDAASLTPSSAHANYPAVNVQDKLPQRTWRTTGLAGQYLILDLGQEVSCNALTLVNTNLTCAGLIQVQASNDPAFATLLLDESHDACHAIIGYGEGGYGDFGWGGYFPESERSFYQPRPIRVIYFDLTAARYWKIAFTDPDNEAGYLAVGRLILTRYTEFTRQFGYNWAYTGTDDSQSQRSIGGQLWIDKIPVVSRLALTWPSFRREDVPWLLLFFWRQVQTTEYFVVDCLPDTDSSERYFTLLYGRLTTVPENTFIDNRNCELIMEIEEVL
jgi:hypothetical protein